MTLLVVGALAHTCSSRAHDAPDPYASLRSEPRPLDPDVALFRTAIGNDVQRSCTITSQPAGAEVRVVEPGGRAYTLGVTPLTRPVVAWGAPRDVLSIELPGYEPLLIDLPTRRPCDRDVELVPVAP